MKKNKIIIIILAIVIIAIIGFLIFLNVSEKNKPNKISEIETIKYGHLNSEIDKEKYKDTFIDNYSKYEKIIKYYEKEPNKDKDSLDFSNYSYLVVIAENDYCGGELKGIKDTSKEGDKLTVNINIEISCGACASEFFLYLVPIAKEEASQVKNIDYQYININVLDCAPTVTHKPLIYLYPEKTTEVNVKLGYEDKLLVSYPLYNNSGWTVKASPNGDLIDLKTKRNLYGLYWEGLNTESSTLKDEGFVVEKESLIPFLEEKLSILGLNEREANEFIIYWLPILQENQYNYIRFETLEEINTNMPLIITPTPDTLIRINMEYLGLEERINVKEQQLTSPSRKGFTVVEWGGTKLNSSN